MKAKGLRAYLIDSKLFPMGMPLDVYVFVTRDGWVEQIGVSTPATEDVEKSIVLAVPGHGTWATPSGYPPDVMKSQANLVSSTATGPAGSCFLGLELEIVHIGRSMNAKVVMRERMWWDLLIMADQSRCRLKLTRYRTLDYNSLKGPQTTEEMPSWKDYQECSLILVERGSPRRQSDDAGNCSGRA
jgi:hypothetical protein